MHSTIPIQPTEMALAGGRGDLGAAPLKYSPRLGVTKLVKFKNGWRPSKLAFKTNPT